MSVENVLQGEIAPGDLVLRCEDAPTASGRAPQFGDVEWRMWFRLEDGRTLHLLMGRATHDRFRGYLLREELDDAADEAAAGLT